MLPENRPVSAPVSNTVRSVRVPVLVVMVIARLSTASGLRLARGAVRVKMIVSPGRYWAAGAIASVCTGPGAPGTQRDGAKLRLAALPGAGRKVSIRAAAAVVRVTTTRLEAAC
jgi:hypothetical protein